MSASMIFLIIAVTIVILFFGVIAFISSAYNQAEECVGSFSNWS